MKKVLVAFLVVLSGLITYSIVNTVQNEPAEGVVEVQPTDPVPVEPTETTTVVIEPMPIPDPEPLPTPDPEPVVFVPLKWDGKRIGRFAKDNNGVIVVVGGIKTVKIGDAYYYKKGKSVYVRHNGIEIKL